ncbi:MAG: hypothetical protein GY922_13550 [Proteobacteria bacterium]|nr:hypothetical protein [Pseudomonadota bacterium]
MAGTAAHSRKGMYGYELCDHLSGPLFFSEVGNYFANFSSSVGSTGEGIYSQQVVNV